MRPARRRRHRRRYPRLSAAPDLDVRRAGALRDREARRAPALSRRRVRQGADVGSVRRAGRSARRRARAVPGAGARRPDHRAQHARAPADPGCVRAQLRSRALGPEAVPRRARGLSVVLPRVPAIRPAGAAALARAGGAARLSRAGGIRIAARRDAVSGRRFPLAVRDPVSQAVRRWRHRPEVLDAGLPPPRSPERLHRRGGCFHRRDRRNKTMNVTSRLLQLVRRPRADAAPRLRRINLLVQACNLTCPMCSMNVNNKDIGQILLDYPGASKGHQLRLEEYKAFFDSLRPYRPDVSISGGEPMLFNRMTELVEYLGGECGYPVGMTTNGTLLDGDKLERVGRALSSVTISIDGLQERHDRIRGQGNFAI